MLAAVDLRRFPARLRRYDEDAKDGLFIVPCGKG